MPLTAKGEKILSNLEKEYGTAKGKEVLYAGKNAGTFTGIDMATYNDADMEGVAGWMDSYRSDATKPGTNQPEPTYNREAVQKAIEASPSKIKPKEAALIHALLKGRGDAAPAWSSKLDALCAAADTFSNRAGMMCDDHRVIGGIGGPLPDIETFQRK